MFLSFELSGSTVPWRKVSILPLLSLSEISATSSFSFVFSWLVEFLKKSSFVWSWL